MSQTVTSQATTAEPVPSTPLPDLQAAVAHVRAGFADGRTRSYQWREQQLKALVRMLEEKEEELVAALASDFGRPPFEGWALDLRVAAQGSRTWVGGFRSWLGPEKAKVPMIFRPGRAEVVREPLGTVLVIAPWNFPIQLLVAHRDVADGLLRLLESEITGSYGAEPRTSSDLGRIVKSRHATRIRTLLDGYGGYHGRWGVETFSHRKAVLRKPSRSIDAPMLRPPYKPWKKWLTRKVF